MDIALTTNAARPRGGFTAAEALPRRHRCRALIAGADAACHDTISAALDAWADGVDIHVAADGEDALRVMQAVRYDCIFVDCRLPGDEVAGLLAIMDGPDWPATAVILVTRDPHAGIEQMPDAACDRLDGNALQPEDVRRVLDSALGRSTLIRQLHEQRIALERLARQVEQLSYVLSRDVQLPLQRVVGDLQCLARNATAPAAGDSGRLLDESTSLAQRVANLVQMTHLGDASGNVQRADFEDVIREAMQQHATALDASGAIVGWDRMPDIACNRRLIVQLMGALLGHLLRCPAHVAPRIHVSVAPEAVGKLARLSFATAVRRQTVWRFTVTDNAATGIASVSGPADVLAYLRACHDSDGVGPSLILCDRIVDLHRGRFWMEPGSSGGTQFLFTLPSVQP